MIDVLRLGHRRGRDDRISTHVGLAARQFGASRVIYSGERDESVLSSLEDVVERWGGPFPVEYREDWRPIIEDFDGTSVHLTMYGLPFRDRLSSLPDEDLLLVVGAEKVHSDVYDLVDHNLSVGNQPHSEISALAVFLHELLEGEELYREFENAELRVIPRERGKKTEDL